jgi:hypothetical protein
MYWRHAMSVDLLHAFLKQINVSHYVPRLAGGAGSLPHVHSQPPPRTLRRRPFPFFPLLDQVEDLLVDFSKQRIDSKAIQLSPL